MKSRFSTIKFLPLISLGIIAVYSLNGVFSRESSVDAPSSIVSNIVSKPAPVSAAEPPPVEPLLTFENLPVEGARTFQGLKERFGDEGALAVLKLNRIDRRHLRKGDNLVVPSRPVELDRLAPFPTELQTARDLSKLVLVSRATQAFAAYENGQLVRWGPVSTGKQATPTPKGLYFTNWKKRVTRSSIDQSWVLPWYVNIENRLGIAFHQYDLPGYAASHGCVRMLEEDAKWVFTWADQWVLNRRTGILEASGTPVIVFGDYSYGKKQGWKQLVEDPKAAAARVQQREAEAILAGYMPTIQEKNRTRRELISKAVAQIAKVGW